jgi:WD40 repeat protein/class 3 adenylate cyclase
VPPSGTVTFLFTDIEGSTRLLERLHGAYADVLAEHRRILRDGFARWNGHEVDTQGDSFFVAFSRASDALSCAVDAQRALSAAKWPEGVDVRVRMGIHTGEPLVAGADYVGMEVHRAARIAAAGHGGQVLVSGTTFDLIADELPQGVKLADLGTYKLKDMRRETRLYQASGDGLRADFAPLVTSPAEEPAPTPGDPPYRGLQAFELSDADQFFGRDEIVAELAERVRDARFLALIGASGSGKSSILRAGLIATLRRQQPKIRILLLTPTAHPLEELAGALRPDAPGSQIAALADEMRAEPRALAAELRKTDATAQAKRVRTVIAVDQLEEVFTLCRDEAERQAFLAALVHASGLDDGPADTPADGDRAAVIATLRADFYAYLAPYAQIRAAASASQLYVGAMSADELRQAIEEPARRGGWEFVPGLVDLLLRDVGDEPGALPLLSHALLETWQRRRGVTMTLRSYAESGGVKGAIARTADRVYETEFSDGQRRIAHDIFVRLTELGEGAQDTRRRARLDEMMPRDSSRATEVRGVIVALADARLITVGEETVEVAHEALIREWPTLREWLRTDRDSLRVHRRLTEAATEWEVSGQDESLLFRGARLAQARESTSYKGALNPLEQRFLDSSIALEERQQVEREAAEKRELEAAQALAAEQSRRAAEAARSNAQLRRRALLLTGVLLLAGVLAGVALVLARQSDANASLAAQRAQEAQDNATLADQRALEASANASLAQGAAQEAQDNETAAQDQARQARAQRLGADASQVLLTGREPELAALLALAGLDTGYTAQADGALQRASRQISGTVFHHDDAVTSVAVTPDGETLFAAAGGRMHIWDVASGEELGQLEMPPVSDDPYVQIMLSDDGSVLLVGDYYAPVAAYRIDPSQPQNAVRFGTDCPFLTGDAIRAMSGDGLVISVFTQSSNTVQFVHLADCTPFGSTIQATTLNDPALNADGSRLVASVSENEELLVWEVATGRELSSFPHVGTFWHASFSPDGSQVAVGTFEGAAALFNIESGQLIRAFGGHEGAVERAIVTPDGHQVLTSSQDGTARLWDVASGNEIRRFAHSAAVRQSVMTADGRWIYTASDDSTVRGWIAEGERSTFSAGDGEVKGLSFSSDGARLASAAGGRIKVFDLNLGATTIDVPIPDARTALFSPTADSLYAISGLGISVLDGSTGAVTQSLTGGAVSGGASAGSMSADGTLLLAPAPGTNAVYLYEAATGDPRGIFTVDTAALSADGTRVVGFFPGRYTVYDATNGSSLGSISLTDTDGRTDTSDLPVDIELTPDGSRMVSGDHDNVVRVRDVETDEIELEMAGHGGPIKQIYVSSDGKLALSGGYDGGARLWDLETGKLLRYFPGHEGLGVTSVAISPDGQAVAIGSADGSVIIAPTSLDSLAVEVCNGLERQLTQADRIAYGLNDQDQPCP